MHGMGFLFVGQPLDATKRVAGYPYNRHGTAPLMPPSLLDVGTGNMHIWEDLLVMFLLH